MPRLVSVHAGCIAPLGPEEVPRRFVKHAVSGSVSLHPLGLEERPNPDFPFARLVQIVNFNDATGGELARLADMAGLAGRIQARARLALQQAPGF